MCLLPPLLPPQDGRRAESPVDPRLPLPLPPLALAPPAAAGGAGAAAGPGAAALLALAVSPRKAGVVDAEEGAGAGADAGGLATPLAAGRQDGPHGGAAELAGGAGLASAGQGAAWQQGQDTPQPTQAGSDWFVQCPTVVSFRSFAGAAAGASGEGATDGSYADGGSSLGPGTLAGVGVGVGEDGAGAVCVTGGPEGEGGSLTRLRAWEGPVPWRAAGSRGQDQQQQPQQQGFGAEGH